MSRRFAALIVLAALLVPVGAGGQDQRTRDPAADFDQAMDAVASGRIKRLSEIMPNIERTFGGRAVETEIETDRGRWVYEFEILTPDGRLFEVDVDAVTGETIEVEEEVD